MTNDMFILIVVLFLFYVYWELITLPDTENQSDWMKGLLAAEKHFQYHDSIAFTRYYAERELYDEGEFANGWWAFIADYEEKT